MKMWENQLKNKNQESNLTVGAERKESTTQFYDRGWDDCKVRGCSQDPDESDHVSNFGLCMAKVGGIRPQSGVTNNNLTRFLPKSAVFRQTIKYITVICHVGM